MTRLANKLQSSQRLLLESIILCRSVRCLTFGTIRSYNLPYSIAAWRKRYSPYVSLFLSHFHRHITFCIRVGMIHLPHVHGDLITRRSKEASTLLFAFLRGIVRLSFGLSLCLVGVLLCSRTARESSPHSRSETAHAFADLGRSNQCQSITFCLEAWSYVPHQQ